MNKVDRLGRKQQTKLMFACGLPLGGRPNQPVSPRFRECQESVRPELGHPVLTHLPKFSARFSPETISKKQLSLKCSIANCSVSERPPLTLDPEPVVKSRHNQDSSPRAALIARCEGSFVGPKMLARSDLRIHLMIRKLTEEND